MACQDIWRDPISAQPNKDRFQHVAAPEACDIFNGSSAHWFMDVRENHAEKTVNHCAVHSGSLIHISAS